MLSTERERYSDVSGRREFESQRSCVSPERGRYSDVSGRRESELQRSCVSPERGRHSDVSGRREFDLVLAQEVLNHDAKLVEEFLGEQLVDDNDVHGLVTSAAGSPCTTALH